MVKNLPANAGDARDMDSIPGMRRCPWSRKWPPTPVFLPVKLHGQRSLAGYSTWSRKESDTTEHTHTQGFLNHLNVKMLSTLLEHWLSSPQEPFNLPSNCKCFMDVVIITFSGTLRVYAFDVGELSVSSKCLQLVSMVSIFHCHFKNRICDFCIHYQYIVDISVAH